MAQDVQKKDSEGDVQACLRLSLIPNFGPRSLFKLLRKHSINVLELLTLNEVKLAALGFKDKQILSIRQPNNGAIERWMKWHQNSEQNRIICWSNAEFPPQLLQIASPPFVLFCRGNNDILQNQQMAIVGSRNPTYSGKQSAFRFAAELAENRVVITSGLALGIDAQAHAGALSCDGLTVAVLGSGVDVIYPKRNMALAQTILDKGGVIVSEFFPDSPAKPENFPRRNRIVSGLSVGVLIVEAAIKSGSLITARMALEQNRDVFAIPGNINNPLSEGCHHLIKQGAKLVDNVTDILDEFRNLNWSNEIQDERNLKKSLSQGLASDKLLDSVEHDVTALDVILQRTKLPIKEVLAQLLEFELRGLVASVSGGYVKLRGK